MASTRIPPDSEELEFIENTRTGTVHILPWDDTPPEKIPEGRLADFAVALLTGPAPSWTSSTRTAKSLLPTTSRIPARSGSSTASCTCASPSP
jgi:hypothetical protein